ncbi:MAG: LysM peptidoglycan-binding domain-containing protein [Pseudomonadota bacterium]
MNQHLLSLGVGVSGCACILYGIASYSASSERSDALSYSRSYDYVSVAYSANSGWSSAERGYVHVTADDRQPRAQGIAWLGAVRAQTASKRPYAVRLNRIVIQPQKGMTFTGRGPLGARIRLRAGQEVLGTAQVGADGTWAVQIPRVFKPGDHQVTAVADQFENARSRTSPDVRISIPTVFRSNQDAIVAYERPIEIPTRRRDALDAAAKDRTSQQRAEDVARAGHEEFNRWQDRQPDARAPQIVLPAPPVRKPEARDEGGLLTWLERAAKGYQEQVVEKLAEPEPGKGVAERFDTARQSRSTEQSVSPVEELATQNGGSGPLVDYDSSGRETDAALSEARQARQRSAEVLAETREAFERDLLERELRDRAARQAVDAARSESEARERARQAEILRRAREAELLQRELRARAALEERRRVDAERERRLAAQRLEAERLDTERQNRAAEAEARERAQQVEQLRALFEQRRLEQETQEREARAAAEREKAQRLQRMEERANRIARLDDAVRAETDRRSAEEAQQVEEQRLVNLREAERLRTEALAKARSEAERLEAERALAEQKRLAARQDEERLAAEVLAKEQEAKRQREKALAERRAAQDALEQRLLEREALRSRDQRIAEVLRRSNRVSRLFDDAQRRRAVALEGEKVAAERLQREENARVVAEREQALRSEQTETIARRSVAPPVRNDRIIRSSGSDVGHRVVLPQRGIRQQAVQRSADASGERRYRRQQKVSVASWRSDPNRKCRDDAGVELLNLPGVYTVAYGDTLWGISERHYGAGHRYWRIYRKNRRKIRNPHWIYPCQQFVLPPDSDTSRHF